MTATKVFISIAILVLCGLAQTRQIVCQTSDGALVVLNVDQDSKFTPSDCRMLLKLNGHSIEDTRSAVVSTGQTNNLMNAVQNGNCMQDIECLYCCKLGKCYSKPACDEEWAAMNQWAFYQVFYTIGIELVLLIIFVIVAVVFKRKKSFLLDTLNLEIDQSTSNIIEDSSSTSRKNSYFIA